MADPTASTMPASVPGSTMSNPYGLTPGEQSWMQSLQGLGGALNHSEPISPRVPRQSSEPTYRMDGMQ